jgi:hypothetical protein
MRYRFKRKGNLILADDCLEDAVKKVGQEAGWSDEELNQMVLHEVSINTPPPPPLGRANQRLFPSSVADPESGAFLTRGFEIR